MNRIAHWCRHNNFLITATVIYEIMIFFSRAGFYCLGEGETIGFTINRFFGKERDGYEKVWGKRMRPYRIWKALRETFPTPTYGWGERSCDISNPYCLYRANK